MVILAGQKLRGAFIEPGSARRGLAFWTMTISAGVVSDLMMAAVVASLQMPAQCGSATLHDVAQDPDQQPEWRHAELLRIKAEGEVNDLRLVLSKLGYSEGPAQSSVEKRAP
jgi:hypothetical protein